ncbi:uncharacterized protein MYCGRDRAFT_40275 [Zymoseptoria tritici IPO323]|uniref:GP-PDE domain-containing protein n=1 Tax=Zymoseptoria tritici (strain CBS 115943 / IPO323) TaxID=336722 RepID=F9X9X5_ZYMTI|nr:uncharacterized protein MYCGRDRAFT_40275 [Zymoseptoria tritici IPO323]EGP88574.1 hypothetical protein MYCGRDRAFT_40275 [Zymoseptoria tritici IPO323]
MLALSLILSHVLSAAIAARLPYDVHKIIDAFRHPHDDLIILCAHRGSRWNGTTENSRDGYFRATQNGIECIETDIRMSADGHIVMLHDAGLGRTTDVGEYTGQTAYNPFTGQGYNPLLRKSNYSGFVENLHLRDEGGRVHIETVPLVTDLVQSIHDTGANVVLQLDFKEKDAVAPTYYALKSMTNAAGVPANEWCIYKTQAVWWKTPEDFEAEAWVQDAFANNISLTLLPVYQPADSWSWDIAASVKAFQRTNYSISSEFEKKSQGGPLQEGQDAVLDGRAEGNFDDEESRRDVADICTSFAIGDLVQPISTAFYDTANFSLPADERVNGSVFQYSENHAPVLLDIFAGNATSDGRDHRSDFDWILQQGNTWVIADTADLWHARLQAEGKRNLTRMLADGKSLPEPGRGWYV